LMNATAQPVERYRTSSDRSTLASPEWSPDGSQLAFLEQLRDTTFATQGTRVLVVDIGSGAVRVVTTVAGIAPNVTWGVRNASSLCWLRGGTRVVFNVPNSGSATASQLFASLYVVGIDGTGLARLTTATNAFDYNVSCSR
jgi:hypothetical protein